MYLPRADTPAWCRRGWGLTYESQKANYNVRGPFWMLCSFAETILVKIERVRWRKAEKPEVVGLVR